MAKRVRGQRTTHRPGGVGPARPDREPSSARRVSTVPSPIAAEATLDQPVTATRATRTTMLATTSRSSTATRDLRARTRLRSGGLEQKAAAEAGWVTEDLRRIGVISAIMLAGLALAWVLFVLVGVGDFY